MSVGSICMIGIYKNLNTYLNNSRVDFVISTVQDQILEEHSLLRSGPVIKRWVRILYLVTKKSRHLCFFLILKDGGMIEINNTNTPGKAG